MRTDSSPSLISNSLILDCSNNSINFLKKRKLQLTELNEQHSAVPTLYEEDSCFDVNQVKTAVSKLPDGYRLVFNLYAFEGYDHKEIGEIMGITEATSKSQYSRAKKKLRNIIDTDVINHLS